MPSRLPLGFAEMIEKKQHRAMVILAYGFAAMKLIENDSVWNRGIAGRQVPEIHHQ